MNGNISSQNNWLLIEESTFSIHVFLWAWRPCGFMQGWGIWCLTPKLTASQFIRTAVVASYACLGFPSCFWWLCHTQAPYQLYPMHAVCSWLKWGTWSSGHDRERLMVGPDDGPNALFQPQRFYNSMIKQSLLLNAANRAEHLGNSQPMNWISMLENTSRSNFFTANIVKCLFLTLKHN